MIYRLARIIRWFNARRVHKTLLWTWLIAGTFVNWALNWQYSIPWVSFMSLYAIVASHWSALDAARAEEAAKPRGYQD